MLFTIEISQLLSKTVEDDQDAEKMEPLAETAQDAGGDEPLS
jgi:hypothetical protein